MEIIIKNNNDVTVVETSGEIDGQTSPGFQEKIIGLIKPDARILIDLSKVNFMSSAGLRVMLLVYREALATQAKIVLTGVSEDIACSMAATGFIKFFTVCESFEAAMSECRCIDGKD